MPSAAKITNRSTMQEVLETYPSAQRAMFRRFHIGGCHSCGYEPEDILEEVAHRHKITDLDEVIEFIEYAEQNDRRLEVSPGDVAAALQYEISPTLAERGEPGNGQAMLRPLRSVVSQAAGCQK